MTTYRVAALQPVPTELAPRRIESIDVVRGIVMILMALDHVRDYFSRDAFLFSPTDLAHTSAALFFTRFATHFCAPVFVLLAGTAAYLYGARNGARAVSTFLITRGLWLVLVEVLIIGPSRTFNPTLPLFNLQVIWAIGISMIALAALLHVRRGILLAIAIALSAGHNLLDGVAVSGDGLAAFAWSLLHVPGRFVFGAWSVNVIYPVLPWIGVICLGYCLGSVYAPGYGQPARRRMLLALGWSAMLLFAMLRIGNVYGDAAPWSMQAEPLFSALSLLNVTKYPPSLLYILLTLGPACVVLALIEPVRNRWTTVLGVFGRVPMFYYILHILIIHVIAVPAAVLLGHSWADMILDGRINESTALRGYGFDLSVVYAVWIGLVIALYPACRWFDRYKRRHLAERPWLSYL